MPDSPRCTLGLLTWNGERDVAACVRSLLAQDEPGIETVWVDNASSDATREIVAREFPAFPAPCIMERNTGFCAGHNKAFQMARGEYYLAVNQDAVLAPDYARLLCDWMDEDPQLALASGLILFGAPDSGTDARICSAGMAMGHGRFPFELHRGSNLRQKLQTRRRVPGVTGAAMLVRRAAATDADPWGDGLFPPEFFAYFEEVDLALRLAEAGWSCGVEGRALAWHADRGQGGKADPAIRAHYLKNHWLLSLRHDSWMDLLREIPALIKGELRHYVPKYLEQPRAFGSALSQAVQLMGFERAARAKFLRRHPQAARGRAMFYAKSRRLLRSQKRRETTEPD